MNDNTKHTDHTKISFILKLKQFLLQCKWSRKGFLRTRWEVKGTVIDLVNIHLFHDASNLAASEEYPSVYCKSRRRALVHTLERYYPLQCLL